MFSTTQHIFFRAVRDFITIVRMHMINIITGFLMFIWICFSIQAALTREVVLSLIAVIFMSGCAISIFEEHITTCAAARTLRAASIVDEPTAASTSESNDDSDTSSNWSEEDTDDDEDGNASESDADSLYTLILNNRHQLLCTSADKQQQVFLTASDSIMLTATKEAGRGEAPDALMPIASWSASWSNRAVITAVFTDTDTLLVLLGKRRDVENSRFYIQELTCASGDIMQEMRLSESMSAAGAIAVAQANELFAIQCNNCTCTLFSCCTGKKVRTLDLEAQGPMQPGVKFLCNGTRLAFIPQKDNLPHVFTLFGEEVLPPRQAPESPTSTAASLDVLAASGGMPNAERLLWHA